MSKKQEERIAQLEKIVMELQSQLLSLSLRVPQTYTITVPPPQPVSVPNTNPWNPPYIGDLPYPYSGTTCSTQAQAKESLFKD